MYRRCAIVVAELVIKYLADIADVKAKLTDVGKVGEELQKQAKGINNEIKGVADSLNNASELMKAAVGTFAAVGLVGVGKQIALVAGRADELQRVMHITGKNAGYTASELDRAEKNMRGFGIATAEARESITKMIQANISLSKSFELARTAQDLAVIAGWNSSETLQRLIVNIQQADMLGLRFMGIVLDSAEAQREYAKSIGIVGRELTRQEKTQATLMGVLKEGQKVFGAYEEAMNSWSKTMRTTERYVQDFQITLGKSLQEPLLHLERGFQQLLLSFSNMEGSLTESTGRLLLMGGAVATLFSGFMMLQKGIQWMVGGDIALKKMLPMIGKVSGALILLSGTEFGRNLTDFATKSISAIASAISGLTKQAKEEMADTTKTVMSLLGESVEIGLVGKFLFGMKTGPLLALMAVMTAVGAVMKFWSNKEVDMVEEAEKRKTKVAKDEAEKREKEVGSMLLQLQEQQLIRELGLDKDFAEISLLNTEAAQRKELEALQEHYKKKIELEIDKEQAERLGQALRLVKQQLLGLTSAWEETSKAIETALKQGPIRKLELIENQINTLREQLKKFPDTEKELILNKLLGERKKQLDELFISFSRLAQEQYKLLAADIGDVGKEKLEVHKKAMDSALEEYERLVEKLKEPIYKVGVYDSLIQISKSEIYDEIGKSLDKVKMHYTEMLTTAQTTMESTVSLQKELLAPSIAEINKMYDGQVKAIVETVAAQELASKKQKELADLEIVTSEKIAAAEKEAREGSIARRKLALSTAATETFLFAGEAKQKEVYEKILTDKINEEYKKRQKLINDQKAATRVSKEAENAELKRIDEERNRAIAASEREMRETKIAATKEVITNYKAAMAEQVSLHEKMVEKIRGLEEQRINVIKAAEDRIKGLRQTAEEKKREISRLGMVPEEVAEDKRREAEELLAKSFSEMVSRTPESLAKAKELAEKAMGKFIEVATPETIRETQNNIDRVTAALERITVVDKEVRLEGIKSLIEQSEVIKNVASKNIEDLKIKIEDLNTSLRKLSVQKLIDIDNAPALAKILEVENALLAIKNRIITIQVKELPKVGEFQFGGTVRAAFGRFLSGYGGGDKVPVMAEGGEFITRKEAVKYYGQNFMEAINSMQFPKLNYAIGGGVTNTHNDSFSLHYNDGGIVPSPRIKDLMREIGAELKRQARRN